MHYWGNYQGTHYSALKQITRDNVPQLQAQWSLQLQGTSRLETQPLVIDGVMYTSGPPAMRSLSPLTLEPAGFCGRRKWRTLWWATASRPLLLFARWLYLEYAENSQFYISEPASYEAGRQYIGRGRGTPPAPEPNDPLPSAGIKALDPETGKTVWDFKLFQKDRYRMA